MAAVLPKQLKVGAFDYEIESWDSLAAESSMRYGECSMLQQKIRVAENLGPQHQGQTLLHEILHAACQQQSILEDGDEQEEVVRALSLGLAAVMRDNPKVFEWILKALT